MTHVYSYPPISGSTQCQVSVLRLYAVLRRECAIILDFFFDEHRQKAHVLFEFKKIKKAQKLHYLKELNSNLRNLYKIEDGTFLFLLL